jgi:hypothetical protein
MEAGRKKDDQKSTKISLQARKVPWHRSVSPKISKHNHLWGM